MGRGERLKRARQEAGLTLERAADLLGTSFNTIWRYEAEQHRPSGPTLYALASLYKRPVEWFSDEKEEIPALPVRQDVEALDSTPEPDSAGVIVSLDEIRNDLGGRMDRLESFVRSAVAESRAEYSAAAVATRDPIDVNEVAAAAGGGAEVYDETVVGHLWFRRAWLQRHSIDPMQCNVITVRGQSMEPTLPRGCSILVDRSQNRRHRRNGRIYVMRTEDGLVVKRVKKDAEGQWQIVSDNPDWQAVPWSGDTEIIGEVRWAARTF